jgi:hypothetical protein
VTLLLGYALPVAAPWLVCPIPLSESEKKKKIKEAKWTGELARYSADAAEAEEREDITERVAVFLTFIANNPLMSVSVDVSRQLCWSF